MQTNTTFPEYLESLELLQQHIRAQLEGLNTTEKGIALRISRKG
jgi:hypothetical protein